MKYIFKYIPGMGLRRCPVCKPNGADRNCVRCGGSGWVS